LATGLAYGAPWFFMAPVGLGCLMLAWMVIVNRRSGLTLTDNQLSLYAGRWHQRVATESIRSVKHVQWSDGGPSITLYFADGSALAVPGYCFGSGNTLIQALASRNITVLSNVAKLETGHA
jgi:hypothetical protein